jgi:hypothetical protein
MPINSCSINAFTINSLACRRHSIVIPPNPTTSTIEKGHPYHNPGSRFWARDEDDANIAVANLESSVITMTVSFNGQKHQSQFDNNYTDLIPLVTIKGLNINTSNIPTIEITNLRHE